MTRDRDWICEDIDFDNRVTNMMWTISGNYDENMDAGERSYLSREVALYQGITAGGRRKYIDWQAVKRFVISRVRAGMDKDTLLALVQMASDVHVEEKIIAERPGVWDIRKKAYNDILMHFYKLHTDNLLDKARHALILEKAGKNPRMDNATSRLIRSIKALEHTEDTIEMLRGVEQIYLEHFPLYMLSEEGEATEERNRGDQQGSDFNDFLYEELYEDELTAEVEDSLDEIAESLLADSLDDASFTGDISDNRVVRIREEDLEKVYEKVSFHYGESCLPIPEVRAISNRVCRGIHENCRIHMTDGVLRSESDNVFAKSLVGRHKTKNTLAYNTAKRINRRNITKLRDSIARTLVQEEMKDRVPSDQGCLVPNKLWRIGRSSNSRVFVRTVDNDKGSYAVDILIDSSGSLRRNQVFVAAQAYILAQALTLNGIPNRVMGFNTFLDYTILKRFRDYESPLSANDNIFEYYCTGNNRDGLAIKATVHDLLKRPEENKILIVLSDGRPNDIKVGKGQSQTLEEAYRGKAGVRDTAAEVRRARQQGVMVLGVFTGKESDLAAEKLIYGKDFAYIREINRFADLVIKYLKQVISI